MKKKNVLIVTPIFPPDIGGPASYSSELASRLSENGCNVKVVAFGEKNQESRIKNQEFDLSIIDVKMNGLVRQWKLFTTVVKQLTWADVVYVQGTLTVGLAVMLACKLKSKSYLVKYVGDEAWEEYQAGGGKLGLEEFLTRVRNKKLKIRNYVKYVLNLIMLKNSKKVICPGEFLKKILKKYYDLNAKNIPNAIDLNGIQNTKYKKQNTICCIGRLVPWKNVDQVIEAFKQLTGKNKWSLVIIGDGVENKNLKRKVKNLRIENSISFTGKISKEETLKYLLNSEFCILYSSYEGLSHTLLEAMGTKTKIVASDIVANRDVLEGGRLGKLVELNDVDGLAKSFGEKYDEKMIEHASEVVNNKYTWDNHLEMLMKIFNS